MLSLFSSHLPETFCPSFPQLWDRWLTCYLSPPWCHAYEADHYMLLKHWSNAFSDTATSNYAGSYPWRASFHYETHHMWVTLIAQGWVQACVWVCLCVCACSTLFTEYSVHVAIKSLPSSLWWNQGMCVNSLSGKTLIGESAEDLVD